jgi:4a-hydroxytetrahydrobiopterin dehydratase
VTDPITARHVHEADGTGDWRLVAEGACAFFRTGSFAAGIRLARAIAELTGPDGHHPDLDVRGGGVLVRLPTPLMEDDAGLTARDLDLARRISAVARELGVPADPSAVQTVQLTIDAIDIPRVMAFWRAVLGYEGHEHSPEDLIDPNGRGPGIWFQRMDAPRPQRNRIHVDVWVPPDQGEARVAAALAAGGRLVSDEHAPRWWALADPEGNEVDVATTQGRD